MPCPGFGPNAAVARAARPRVCGSVGEHQADLQPADEGTFMVDWGSPQSYSPIAPRVALRKTDIRHDHAVPRMGATPEESNVELARDDQRRPVCSIEKRHRAKLDDRNRRGQPSQGSGGRTSQGGVVGKRRRRCPRWRCQAEGCGQGQSSACDSAHPVRGARRCRPSLGRYDAEASPLAGRLRREERPKLVRSLHGLNPIAYRFVREIKPMRHLPVEHDELDSPKLVGMFRRELG